jgi:hypothetical protein
LTGVRAATASPRPRPRDWHPLTETDPVPGDPDAILEEVGHMKRLATMLRGEAKDLRVIGEGEQLEGRYADALRDGARELETHLRETAERYERVHGHLTGWAHELEVLQSDAERILRRARAAAEQAPTASSGESGESGEAREDGSTAGHRKALAGIEADRDERATHYAARIRHEIDDKIKDSWWERRKNALDDAKDVISFAVDVLSWVATGIAVAALVLTPAGWVTGLVLWLTVGVLAGHTVLAAAGAGSWADVAMDVFGLLTMGIGTAALAGLRDVRTATKLAAALAARERAAATASRASRSVRGRTSAVTNRHGATRAARATARHRRNIARAATRRAGSEAAADEAATPMGEASRWEAVRLGGDREAANLSKDVLRLRAAYPESGAVRRASEGAEGYTYTFQGTWIAASAVDGVDKLAGSSDIASLKPLLGPHDDVKGRFSREVGTRW